MADRRRPPNDRRPRNPEDRKRRLNRDARRINTDERRGERRPMQDEPRRKRRPIANEQRERRRERPMQDERRPRQRRPGSRNRAGNYESPVRRRRRSKRNNQIMTIQATLVIVLFFGFVIAYIALRFQNFFSQEVGTMTLRLGNMEQQQSVPGLIVRHENVYHASRDGHVIFTVREFERVRAGVPVASIRDIEAVSRTEQEMERLQREIMDVHEMRHATAADPLIERLNTDLRNRMSGSMYIHMNRDLNEVYALLRRLTEVTESRNNVIINESVSARTDLNNEHNILSLQTERNLSDIYATQTGIMSPIVDGYEDRFTPYDINDLSPEDVRTVVDHDTIIPARDVKEGDAVFKIVTSNIWFVVTRMPHEMANALTQGADRTIFLENARTGRYEPLVMRVEKLEYFYHDAYVVLRSTRNIENFLHQRNVNIRITENVQSGFVIPSSAVAIRRSYRIPLTHVHFTDEGDAFVMHRRDEGMQLVPIHWHDSTDTHVLVLEDSIRLVPNDALSPVDPIHTLHFISEADMLVTYGVYRTTLGSADFSQITLYEELPEGGGNILLDPTQNPGLRQFDSIVIDAALVRQGQVIG